MAVQFVHLHVHSEYSLLDGLPKIKNLIAHVKNLKMGSLALTDHGVMYGVIEFYKEANKQGIKPIIGMEAYITDSDLAEKVDRKKSKNYHLLLLAKNEQGYKNLMRLTSIAHLQGFYYKPRIDRDVLKKYAKGLICSSACEQGEVAQALIAGDYEKARKIASWYQALFGDDYYLELQRHQFERFIEKTESSEIKESLLQFAEREKIRNDGKIKLSRDLGIPLIATNDTHYLKKEDAVAQDTLVCISTGKVVSDLKRLRYVDTPDFYVKSQEEMALLFKDYPEAIENTVKISQKCDLNISSLGKWFFPKFPLPQGLSAEDYLRKLTYDRLKMRFKRVKKTLQDRVEHELKIIIEKGYAPYFLIFMDIINWANKKGIVTNTRGSVAGSLVSYVLGITSVDPIEYYLPFERFLNPFRPSPPDIDADVADDRRDEVLDYIRKKYGQKSVAQICTFGRMLSRASVRDVARVLGYPYATGDKIAKLIPPPRQGFPVYIVNALDEVVELRNLYNADSDAKKILDLARQIEGNVRHVSVHAAGVVVSPTDVADFSPVQKEPSGEKVITQYEMHACEDVGLIKLDILGIRNLSILGAAIDKVKQTQKLVIDLSKIPLDDKKTFAMLGRGETTGVFQFSGSGMTRYLKELKPERVDDLMAMVALYRPGPLQVIPEYIKRKKNPKLVKYLDPRMEKFLDRSYGLIVYQDDLLFCALELAGYSWEEADKFRKAVGKKIPEEMTAQKQKFIKGIIDNGQTKAFADKLWELFEPFQSYGFNKAHAASYGIVAYQTAYMKANFPVEYMTALLTAESGNSEKIADAVAECRRMKIKVLPPDINESDVGFTIIDDSGSLEGKAIRFGLSAVKNVGVAAIEAILQARKDSQFVSLADFCSRVDGRRVNKKVLESLINVGALSQFGNRASLIASLDSVRSRLTKNQKDKNQQALFDSPSLEVNVQNKDEYDDEQIEKLEQELLGFSLSAKSLTEKLSPFVSLSNHKIQDLEEEFGELVTIAALISDVRIVITKKSGAQMAFVRARDETGSINIVVFPKTFQTVRDSLVVNKVIVVSGKVDWRDEELSLIAESLEVSSKEQPAGKFYIDIPPNTSVEKLKTLRALLQNYPGESRVVIVINNGHKNELELPFRVKWSKGLSKKVGLILEN